MTNKYIAVTTFPAAAWDFYAKLMLTTFVEHWPADIPLIVVIDQDENAVPLSQEIKKIIRDGDKVFGTNEETQNNFLIRHKDRKEGKDYRNHYVRFSHKVFATWKASVAQEAAYPDVTHLIWLDADIITNKAVTTEFLDSIAPGENQSISYMGRKDWTATETGFAMFNLVYGGRKFIEDWRNLYITDRLFDQVEKTDAFGFDMIRKSFPESQFRDLTDKIDGRDVFDYSPLAPYMTHFKGARKHELAERTGMDLHPKHGNTFNVGNLGIRTMNCVQSDVIKENVSKNLRIIENWLPICPPNGEEIVIANAGPSLPMDEIKKWYDKGTKIVAVKHALDRLLKENIVPWACILLDPRPHVGNFLMKPNRDINYFIASMVDPEVTLHLREMGCKIYGYHAMVNGGEEERVPKGHYFIQGGSATCMRGISLLETMGFSTMHLYGYDLSYAAKPDLKETKPNGKLKYEEVTLSVETWGGGQETRTFWTEGQFLAQVQEYRHMYYPKPGLKLYTYGDGIIPWMHKNLQRHNAWIDTKIVESVEATLKTNININEYLHGTDKSRPEIRTPGTGQDSGAGVDGL